MDYLNLTDNLFGARKTKKKVKKAGLKAGMSKKAARKLGRKSARKVRRAGIKKTAGAVVTAPLLPFKSAMSKMLEAKGLKTDKMNFQTLIQTFFNTYMKKGSKSFDELSDTYISNNWLWNTYDSEMSEEDWNSIDPVTIGAVVTAVVKFFKEKKDKKAAAKAEGIDAKKVLSPEEMIAANETEKVVQKLEEKETEDRNVKAGQIKKIVTYVIIAGIAAVGLYFLSKKLQ